MATKSASKKSVKATKKTVKVPKKTSKLTTKSKSVSPAKSKLSAKDIKKKPDKKAVKPVKAKTSPKAVKKEIPTKKAKVKEISKPVVVPSLEAEAPKRKRGRPSLKDKAANLGLVAGHIEGQEAPVKRGRGRPRKNPLPDPSEVSAGPKKRGRKPKVQVAEDGSTLLLQPGQLINPDIPIKRKRGRPRKSEQLGYGMSGPGRYSFIPRPNVQVKRYIWSAETGQSLSPDGISAEAKDAALAESRASDQVVEFREKDKVVYPAHGLGIVEAIQVRNVSGSPQKFYMISIVETGMKIMVPVSQAKTVGLRRVVDPSTVDKVYAILKDKDVEIDNQTWNRRYREYTQKIKTGSVLEIASVIRDLTVLKIDKELSFNERRMLDSAQGLLVKELSIAKSSPEDTIREELEEICQP